MALSQTQIIQSLAEALNWFEKEIEWGVKPAELKHLTGRIGELYAAMITRGQMALETNQKGYDVVSAENQKISVKTFTTSSSVNFNKNTFEHVDRVIILRLNIDSEAGISIEEILDCLSSEAKNKMRESEANYTFATKNTVKEIIPLRDSDIIKSAKFENYTINQYESGTIKVLINGIEESVAKPILREIAAKIGVDILNDSNRRKNTRQLGANIILMINDKS